MLERMVDFLNHIPTVQEHINMRFFPHNVPTGQVYSAVSASLALSSSLINNFTATPVSMRVNTASLALNISGARGADGTSVAVYGPTGPTGPQGVNGFRGNSVYLLSGSWHSGSPCTTPPANCYTVLLYGVINAGGGNYACDFSNNPPTNPTTYYTTDVTADPTTGIPMFVDQYCAQPVAANSILGAWNATNQVIQADAGSLSGVLATCFGGGF
jgi:hypothetical protein